MARRPKPVAPRPERLPLAAVLAAIMLIASPAAAPAESMAKDAPDKRLKEIEAALEKGQAERDEIRKRSEALSKELSGMRDDMVKAAEAVQEHEENLSELELQLKDLGAIETEKLQALDRKRQQLNGVLTALQRLAFRPSEALIAQPTSPADTVRSAILLRDVLPKLQEQTKSLKADLDSLASLRIDIGRQKQKVTAAAAGLDSEHRRLSALYQRKQQLVEDTAGQQREKEEHLAALGSEAQDLRDLLARIEEEKLRRQKEAAEKAAAEKAAREAEKAAAKAAREAEIAAAKAAREAEIAAAKAAREKHDAEIAAARTARQAEEDAKKLARDAEARADVAARDADAAAKASPKEQIEAQGQPRSFSHAEGQMPFPARGRILTRYGQPDENGATSQGITIETRPGGQVVAPYDGTVVFAGPFRGYGLLLIIEHSEGYHTLLSGMARLDDTVGQHLLAGEPVGIMGQAEGTPLLYVELRHNGQPVNPLPWLTARKTKVSG